MRTPLVIYDAPDENRVQVTYKVAPLKNISIINFSSFANYDHNHAETRTCYVDSGYVKEVQGENRSQGEGIWFVWVCSIILIPIATFFSIGVPQAACLGFSGLFAILAFMTLVVDSTHSTVQMPLIEQLKKDIPMQQGFPCYEISGVKVHYNDTLQPNKSSCSTWSWFGVLVLIQVGLSILALAVQ